MSSYDVTPIEAAVLAYLRAHLERRGRSPCPHEITRQLSLLSLERVEQSLKSLEKKGYVSPCQQVADKPRGRKQRGLTARQSAVLNFVRDHTMRLGYPPTVREIADRFGIASPNGVIGHLKALENKGFIRRSRKRSRAIICATIRGGNPSAA